MGGIVRSAYGTVAWEVIGVVSGETFVGVVGVCPDIESSSKETR